LTKISVNFATVAKAVCMVKWREKLSLNKGYLIISAIASACAALFSVVHGDGVVPVLGSISLPQTTLCAAIIGFPLLNFCYSRVIDPSGLRSVQPLDVIALVGLGAILAIPPVLIDITTIFPQDINVLLPDSLLFYPAIALVAEVAFHLIPLAALTILTSRRTAPFWVFVAVVFVEPVFQAIFSLGAGIQAWLVFGNVSLISAAQIWIFRRHGFGAMFGLRVAYYFFWHVIWGSARLVLLF